MLIKRLDHDRDGLLTYTEVCDIFKPKERLISKTFIDRCDGSMQTFINPEYIPRVREVFIMTLNQEERMEEAKGKLQESKNFKITESYNIVNRTNKAKVDKV